MYNIYIHTYMYITLEFKFILFLRLIFVFINIFCSIIIFIQGLLSRMQYDEFIYNH